MDTRISLEIALNLLRIAKIFRLAKGVVTSLFAYLLAGRNSHPTLRSLKLIVKFMSNWLTILKVIVYLAQLMVLKV